MAGTGDAAGIHIGGGALQHGHITGVPGATLITGDTIILTPMDTITHHTTAGTTHITEDTIHIDEQGLGGFT